MTLQTATEVPATQQGHANMTQRILVVEDEVALASGIRDALTHAGFEAEVVHDGAAALEAFKKSRFDLIVLDLMLPGKSGLEVLKELRAKTNPFRLSEAVTRKLGIIWGLASKAKLRLAEPPKTSRRKPYWEKSGAYQMPNLFRPLGNIALDRIRELHSRDNRMGGG